MNEFVYYIIDIDELTVIPEFNHKIALAKALEEIGNNKDNFDINEVNLILTEYNIMYLGIL